MIIQKNQNQLFFHNTPCFKGKQDLVENALKKSIEKTPQQLAQNIEANIAKASLLGLATASIINPLANEDTSFADCLKAKEEGNFHKYLEKLLKFLRKNHYSEETIECIRNCNSFFDTVFELQNEIDIIILKSDNTINRKINIAEVVKNKSFNENIDNIIQKEKIEAANKILPLVKLCLLTDKNESIVATKEKLKNKYNLKDIYLNNDPKVAKACEEVFEILEKNNIKFNGTLIVGNCLNFGGINLNSAEGNIAIINPYNTECYYKAEKEIILHEILHSLQPKTLEFNSQEIPKEYRDIIANISDYAINNHAHEVHCELYVKKLLKGLSPKEEELFNCLGGPLLN